MRNLIKLNKIIFIILFILAFLVIFNSTYSPINFRRMHVDSSVYVTIAQGIVRGYLPYEDFVDNKGPLIYLINAAGLSIGGFNGIWIIELIFMFISVLFAYKTALLFENKFIALIATVFSFVVLLAFFSVNAGTGEYALPFMMISLFIFTNYFFKTRHETRFHNMIILGICFSCVAMIQLNLVTLWIGFCLVIFIENIINKRFIELSKYIIFFLIGTFIIIFPIFLFLQINEILYNFFTQVIFGGASRGFSASGLKDVAKNFYIVINRTNSILPLVLGFILIIINYKKENFTYYLAYTISVILSVLLISFSSGDGHYNMVLVPFFIPVLAFIAKLIDIAFSGKKYKNFLLIFFFFLVFSEGIVNYLYDSTKILTNNSGRELIATGKLIDQNTVHGDKIISLGFNSYIYPFTQRDAASKYIYQGSGLDHISGAKEEFISDILNEKPAVIALFNAEDGIGQIMYDWHDPIFKMIESDYRILSTENGFILYIRN